jgi:hypothetical protein
MHVERIEYCGGVSESPKATAKAFPMSCMCESVETPIGTVNGLNRSPTAVSGLPKHIISGDGTKIP